MKILVISSNLIGDTILSTCVIEYFVKKYPNSKFTFLTGPSSGQIYEYFPNKEKIISIKKKKFNLHWINMYLNSYKKKWDVTIDFRSSLLSYFLFSKKRFIFKKNKNINHLDQLKKSFNLNNTSLVIHTSKMDDLEAKNIIKSDFKYVIIFPGGNWNPKIWPAESFNELIKKLIKKYSNLKFIIVGSNNERTLYLEKISKGLSKDLFIDIMGKSLSYTSAFMKLSNLFIGNDSGLMHLSIASKLTTISLFGPTDDKVYGHFNLFSHVIRTNTSFDDFNRNLMDFKKSYMQSIKPYQVFELIDKIKVL